MDTFLPVKYCRYPLPRLFPSLRKLVIPQRRGTGRVLQSQDYAFNVYRHFLSTRFMELTRKLCLLNPLPQIDLVEKAFLFASQMHAKAYRKTGEPYIVHPLAVAEIALEAGIPDPIIAAAALLHDTVEDTGCSLAKLEFHFNPVIAMLVDGVSKYGREHGDRRERLSLAKTIDLAREDIRVVLVRLCDRLHNMRTLGAQRSEKQIEIARETFDSFAPLANMLGFRYLYRELMDLSLFYLRRESFELVALTLNQMAAETAAKRKEIIGCLAAALAPLVDHSQIVFTPRRPFEVFEKEAKRRILEVRLTDIFSFLILTDTVEETDVIIGRLHRLPEFHFAKGTFVDLIGHPSPNGYQAKHTRVATKWGLLRVQVTTRALHAVNESGAAARMDEEKWYIPPKNVLEEWVTHLKGVEPYGRIRMALSLSGKRITVFAAKPGREAKPFEIPLGATALDLAYYIHSEKVGPFAAEAEINGEDAKIDRVLGDGDRIFLLLDLSRRVQVGDLDRAHTLRAAAAIRGILRKEGKIDSTPQIEIKERLKIALKILFLEPEDLNRPETKGLLAIIVKQINTEIKGKNIPEENGFHVLLDRLEDGSVPIRVLVNLIKRVYLKNERKMKIARKPLKTAASAAEKAAIRRERKRICRLRLTGIIPDSPGIIGRITSFIGALGLNLNCGKFSQAKDKKASFTLTISLTWALHQIQIERIIQRLGGTITKIEVGKSGKGWKRSESILPAPSLPQLPDQPLPEPTKKPR